MVFASVDNQRQRLIEIRPNRSLSWREAKIVYGGIGLVCLSIALGCASLGYWPVLPFAGLELFALGSAYYLVALDGQRREVVRVDEHTVAVEKGRRRFEQSWRFTRAWTSVIVSRPSISWYPTRLLLRSHGKEIELGGFLDEGERRALATELRRALIAPWDSDGHSSANDDKRAEA